MDALDRIRRPEYTGENRCLPCTVVNAVLAVALAAGVAAAVAWARTLAHGAVAAGAVLAASALSIWLRGYLVPGTPALTKRYMPPWLLAWFGKEPAAPEGTVAGEGSLDVERVLREADVLEPCAEVDDLCLTEEVAAALDDAFEAVDEDADPDAIADALGIEGDLTVATHGDAVTVRRDGRPVGQWPSGTALRADVAAARVLADRIGDWPVLPPDDRGELLAGVRLFLERCPDGSAVEVDSETVESCCSSREVVTVRCSGSGDRLLEQPVR